MHILFEEGGKFYCARLLSQADSSMQAEMDSGKRIKIKSALVLLQFNCPDARAFMGEASAMAQEMDVDLAWECAADDEFHFSDLAAEYFGAQVSVAQQAACLMCLFNAPHYFRRAGKGRFKKASAEVVKQALAAIEKKKQVTAQIADWAEQLAARDCPDAIKAQLYKILFKPDKNASEYKAVVQASRVTHTAPLDLLKNAGAISSAYEFHWQRFALEFFPQGTAFAALGAPSAPEDLPLASVQAFSIDDSQTTEIDDALSVQGLGSGQVIVGIHIAAPGLAIQPGDGWDQVARQRYSTVYMPGHKITMLPESVVQQYTLAQGRACPALSLYLHFDEATLAVLDTQTRLERVPIAHNLRHDQLDAVVSPAWLCAKPNQAAVNDENSFEPIQSLRTSLSFLYRLALHLKAQREQVRGKPEVFSRPDYNFKLNAAGAEGPKGDEPVQISVRSRGAPLDLMVAECMILANSTWGQWLAKLGVPGIYRSQMSLAPGVKVRMSTKALPHAGIGVPSYAWSTSPLRRYVDLLNQWQLIACVKYGSTAALAAPFKPKDAQLFAIVSGFDAAYSAYNTFQSAMERYWTLKYVEQRGIKELVATVIKEGLVRAQDIPLVMTVAGVSDLPRGARVKVKLLGLDLLMLEAHATVLERMDTDALEPSDNEAGEADEDELPVLELAMDVNEDIASAASQSQQSSP